MKSYKQWLVIMAVIGLCGGTQAAVVNWNYSAFVSEYSSPLFNSWFPVGSVMSISLTYDTSLVADSYSGSIRGLYTNAITSLSLSHANYSYSANSGGVSTANDYNWGMGVYDQIIGSTDSRGGFMSTNVLDATTFASSGYYLSTVLLYHQSDTNLSALVSDALPTTVPNPTAFESKGIQLVFAQIGDASNTKNVVAITEAIPEPASAVMIGFGGLLVIGYRRMRKSYGHF